LILKKLKKIIQPTIGLKFVKTDMYLLVITTDIIYKCSGNEIVEIKDGYQFVHHFQDEKSLKFGLVMLKQEYDNIKVKQENTFYKMMSVDKLYNTIFKDSIDDSIHERI
jgi:hypothetical protein